MNAVVVAPGAGRFIAVGSAGAGVMVKASTAETGGLCTVWEGRVPAGTVGAGPHYHRGRDEFFYVLEGEVMLRIGDDEHTARAGTFAFVPRDTIHGFHNASTESATLVVMHHPADDRRREQTTERHVPRSVKKLPVTVSTSLRATSLSI